MNLRRAFRSLLPLLLLALPASAAPVLRQVTPIADGRYALRGEDLGVACARCEVIVRYPGLRYAAEVDRWSEREIVARLPDLNRGGTVTVAVHTPQGATADLTLQLTPRIASPEQLKSLSPSTPALFEHASELKVGDRGEEQFPIGVAAPKCGETAWMFDRAELRHVRRRFGEAQIVSPPPPCIDCPPLRVRWYHEPTGYVHFQVLIYRRAIQGVCADRVR